MADMQESRSKFGSPDPANENVTAGATAMLAAEC
jgi:hypothetical protein